MSIAEQRASPSVSTAPASAIAASSATTAPSISATQAVAPSAAPTETPVRSADARLFPTVAVAQGVFPITTPYRVKLATVDENVMNAARYGVERYLESIDAYRNGTSPALPITGRFLAAVSAALKDSAAPGVKRTFMLESLSVDRHVQKPWGTHAYVEVTATIVDRAVGGSAPDQRETGKLRLTGDKLFVTDAWDYENGRWFNGFGPLPLEQVRAGVAEAVANYLVSEIWIAPPPAANWGVDTAGTPYLRARTQRMSAVDPTKVTAEFFENVRATIDQFETIEGIWSGVATVHLTGTTVTTTASGTTRTPLERHVRVFVLGNWSPEVVDEQFPSRDWASGGDLALDRIDTNRA